MRKFLSNFAIGVLYIPNVFMFVIVILFLFLWLCTYLCTLGLIYRVTTGHWWL